MSSFRRSVAVVFAVLSIGAPALAVDGCGATGHLVGGIVAHHVLSHIIGARGANKVFCLYHGHRVLVDFRNHHAIIAGLNLLEAARACKAGFFHSH
jgi:hypothetical protein